MVMAREWGSWEAVAGFRVLHSTHLAGNSCCTSVPAMASEWWHALAQSPCLEAPVLSWLCARSWFSRLKSTRHPYIENPPCDAMTFSGKIDKLTLDSPFSPFETGSHLLQAGLVQLEG